MLRLVGKMRRILIGSLAAIGLFVFAGTAMAEDKVVYKKRTVIDLSGAVIEGELTRPEGSYIVNRKVSKFAQLIQDRRDFIPELKFSSNDL